MNYKNLQFIFYIGILLLFSLRSIHFKEEKTSVILVNNITKSVAGSPISLSFKPIDKPISLYVTNSYSTSILEPELLDEKIVFHIPEHIYNKRGIITWKVISETKELATGDIYITPYPSKTVMETYAGPPSIIAGGVDYYMLVACPSDSLDNPVPEKTLVHINHQFKKRVVVNNRYVKDLIAWKIIHSYSQSGRILTNSECNNVSSKEITIEVFPNNPVDFSISSILTHDYSDGNQIATFKTSKITDQFGNTVSDGTHVMFVIKNSDNVYLTTYGNTIDGVASASMLHPYKEETWEVYAYVDGMAETETITVSFKKLFDSFEVKFSENNRLITVGPFKSFMEQLIPDGFVTKLKIIRNDSLIETKEALTRKGFAQYKLPPDFYPNNQYDFIIEAGGHNQKFSQKELKH